MRCIAVFALILGFASCSETLQQSTSQQSTSQQSTAQSQPNTVIKKTDVATDALPVQKDEAQAITERHLRKEGRDLSMHRLGTVRLVQSSSWMKSQHWIVTWELKTPSDGGQIVVLVDMNKKIRVVGGR